MPMDEHKAGQVTSDDGAGRAVSGYRRSAVYLHKDIRIAFQHCKLCVNPQAYGAGSAILWRLPHVSAEAGHGDAHVRLEDSRRLYWLAWLVAHKGWGHCCPVHAGEGGFRTAARIRC